MAEGEGGGDGTAFDNFLKRVNTIQLLIAAVGGQVLALLLGLSIDSRLARILAVGLALAVLAGAYLTFRAATRRRAAGAERQSKRQAWAAAHLQAAFRGLYSYTRRDELPGGKRQQLAHAIATAVASPLFRYGLVSGEVGAGKSSLLDSAVCKELDQSYAVILVRGLQDRGADHSLPALLAQLRERLGGAEGDRVLVIDQFEELLIEWPARDDRQTLGAFLNEPVQGAVVRVVCSVRADYIIGMHDLAPALPDPTSARSMFPVNNLDEQEAAEIIVECSGRDGMEIDVDLAKAIAADLSQGGHVRPAELQLVCQSLRGATPERTYRESGGARGILSDYVKNALDSSVAPDLGRLALRTLCNLDAAPPTKMPPRTAREIAATIGAPAEGHTGPDRLDHILRHLIDAGLVKRIGGQNGGAFTLTHDYLVQPVMLATSDASTQTERADQLLKLHLAEHDADQASRIPFRRLGLIRHHASRELLATAGADALIRRSYRATGIRTALIAIMIVGAGVFLAVRGMQMRWDRVQLAMHADARLREPVSSRSTPDGREVLSQDAGGIHLSWWDARSGRALERRDGARAWISQSGTAMVYLDGPGTGPHGEQLAQPIRIFRQAPSRPNAPPERPILFETPLFGRVGDDFRLNATGDYLVFRQNLSSVPTDFVQIWGLAERRMVVARRFSIWPDDVQVGKSGGVVLSGHDARGGRFLDLFIGGTERLVPLISYATLDPTGRFTAAIGLGADGRAILSLWDMATGNATHLPATGGSTMFFFSRDGRYLIVIGSRTTTGLLANLRIYSVPGLVLLPAPRSLSVAMLSSSEPGAPDYLISPAPDGSAIAWNLGQATSAPMHVRFEAIAAVVIARDGGRAIVADQAGGLALYDTRGWRKLPFPDLPGTVGNFSFTADGGAITVMITGGGLALIDASTGALIHTFVDVSRVSETYYDRACERVHFWTEEGLVFRYTRGRSWPLLGFRPSRRCT